MKNLSLLILTLSVMACDPYGFGFKNNPAYVMDEAFKAITNLDVESFLEVTAKEALCVYGNEKGVLFLKDQLQIKNEDVRLIPKMSASRHNSVPVFVGYWSYYHERYTIEIRDRATEKLLVQTIIDCDYGTDGEKSPKLLNLRKDKYKKKECRAVKLIPASFTSLQVPPRCDLLRVDL